MALTLNLAEGTRFSQTADGYKGICVALVDGLSDNPDRRIYQALNYPGIPAVGQPHPVMPGVAVVEKTVVLIDGEPSKAHVEIRYDKRQFVIFPDRVSETSKPLITVGGSVQPMTTCFDINNKQIVLYRYDPSTSQGKDEENIQVATVTYYAPQQVVRYERREPKSPGEKSRRHLGTVNCTSVFGDRARFWLCTRIEGRSIDGGATYDVAYEFQRNESEQGWVGRVVYEDPEKGRPIKNPVSGRSAKWVQLYRETEFRKLRLTT